MSLKKEENHGERLRKVKKSFGMGKALEVICKKQLKVRTNKKAGYADGKKLGGRREVSRKCGKIRHGQFGFHTLERNDVKLLWYQKCW